MDTNSLQADRYAKVRAASARYTGTAQALHWIVVVLMFSVVPLAWVMVNMPQTAPDRDLVYTLHKSVGVTILALAVIRLAWRATHPTPAPRHAARWDAAVSAATHWLLYLILFLMPVSGYLLSSASGASVSYFGLFDLPALSRSDALSNAAKAVHLTTQWAVYALVLLHLAGTAWHVVVRRDGTLERMLPPQH